MTQTGSQFVDCWYTVRDFKMLARVSMNQQEVGPIPVVLLHGLGVSGRYMLPTAERLAMHYKVFVPGLPGFGRSDKPPHALSVEALADLLSAWLEATGIDQTVFLGNSLGCQVIVDLAVRYPRQVHSAILVAPTVDRVGHTFMRQLWRAFRDLLREPWSLWPILALDYWATGTKRLFETCRVALSDPVQKKFSQMHVPTLVVRGSRDPIVPQRWVEEIVTLLPRGELVVIQNGTHATNYSAPDELARITSAFIADQD